MNMKISSYIRQIPELAPFLDHADHVDVKIAIGDVSMRKFITSMLGYQPGWVRLLYHVRAMFVRFLGMRQEGVPQAKRLKPEDLPMKPGSHVAFFTVRMAEEERYWVAEAEDRHLKAALGVIVEPLGGNRRRFHLITVVYYHNWAGPVYFNVIRPFHHLDNLPLKTNLDTGVSQALSNMAALLRS